ncbi:MAG: serine aminopeptidase domain-containing protein [Solirubrobacteraceae bacterium]
MTELEMEEALTPAVTGTPLWLDVEPDAVYAVLHAPPTGVRSRVAALIVPAFGWESECAYRSRRDWAIAFASAGVTAARFDFPGTEDSVGSPTRSGRFQSQIDATAAVARWLREETGCVRLVLVGAGLGGIVGYLAVAQNAAVDDLVLWGVRASGRAYIREQQAFSAVSVGEQPDARDAARPDGVVGIAGHRMSAETVAALSAVDLTAVPLADAPARRVLLIERDAAGVDRRLRDHLQGLGVDLTVMPADDYRLLVMVPDMGQSPVVTIRRSVDWVTGVVPAAARQVVPTGVAAAASGRVAPISPEPAGCPQRVAEVQFEYDGVQIRERLLRFRFGSAHLSAVLAEPVVNASSRVCVVTVNSAWLRRTGPNRVMVELTRRAAAAGLAAVRLDLPGLGDSEGDAGRVFERDTRGNEEALRALQALYDELEAAGIASRFVSVGLCLGGYIAAASALSDRRVSAVVGINPQLAWGDRQRQWQRRWAIELGVLGSRANVATADSANARLSRLRERITVRVDRWRKAVQDALGPRVAHNRLFWRLYWYSHVRNVGRLLKRLGESGLPVLLVSGIGEGLTRDVQADGPRSKVIKRWANIRFVPVGTNSHLLHPLWSQDELFDIVAPFLAEIDDVSSFVASGHNHGQAGSETDQLTPTPEEETQSAK